MFVTAVCFLFLLKLKWPKNKNRYDFNLCMRMSQILDFFAITRSEFKLIDQISLSADFFLRVIFLQARERERTCPTLFRIPPPHPIWYF